MKRILLLSVCLLGLGATQASAQFTVTLGGASTVASANDFATAAFQDPWDMNERTDVGWWLNSVDQPFPGFSGATFAGGIFSGTVSADPNLWLLETGVPNLPAIGKNGNSFSINANLYRIVAVRMRLSEPGYMLFHWSTKTIYDSPGLQTAGINGGAQLPTTAGWRIYFVDLASLTLVGGSTEPWNGIKRSLRFDPAPDNATPGSVIDIDWIRLVDVQPALARTVSWSSAGGNVDIYLDNDNTATTDPNQTLGLLAQNVSGSTYSLNTGALPPGTYYVAMRRTGTNGALVYSSTTYQVNGPATVKVTAPSDEGSADDFATVHLNNAWDMTSPADVDTTLNMTNPGVITVPGAETEAGAPLGSITAYAGTSTTGEFNSGNCTSFAKPVVYPLDPAKRGATAKIDAGKYRIFTAEMGLQNKARDLCGGSIMRVGWQVDGQPEWTSSWGVGLNSRAGTNVVDRIIFDMATIQVDAAGASQAPWAAGSSIKGFRVDPHEFANPTSFFIKRLKLAAFESANTTYTVRWTSSKAAGTVRVYYDTDQDPGAKTLIGTTGSASTEGSLPWNTAGLPQGARYYVYVEFDDGINTNGAYSKWPVVIDHTSPNPPASGPGVQGDFDGDGRTDLVVFRPSTASWYIRYSSRGYDAGSYGAFPWGLPGDLPISGDADGDRVSDLTVFRPSTSEWLIRYSSQGYNPATAGDFHWGLVGDVPLSADFDGDGRLDLTVYRPSTGQWFISYSSQGYSAVSYGLYQWGLFGDMPLAADFDGDGKADVAVYRPSTGEWLIRYSTQGYSTVTSGYFQWGLLADVPLVADFDGDGRTDLTVYRPSTGEWFVRVSTQGYASGGATTYQWGLPGDTPAVTDLDGDGKADLTVYRPSSSEWFVRYSSLGYSSASGTYQWGLQGDLALPATYDAARHPGDFDGDGQADLTLYRPSSGVWYVRASRTGYDAAHPLTYQWGLNGDVPVAGDFDGDRRPDLVVFRPSSGGWYVRYSSQGFAAGGATYYQWGLPGDIPLAADLDGDGKADLIVYRPSSGYWFILYSAQGYSPAASGLYQWGLNGDVPIAADFDGDGRGELALYRPSTAQWFVLYSRQGYSTAASGLFQWGLTGDVPVAGDFDGDGRSDVAVYRPGSGRWLIRYSSQGYNTATAGDFQWGLNGDVPLVRDFDGDGRAELTVYRPSTGEWFVRYSLSGYGGSASYQWGLGGDTPVPQQ